MCDADGNLVVVDRLVRDEARHEQFIVLGVANNFLSFIKWIRNQRLKSQCWVHQTAWNNARMPAKDRNYGWGLRRLDASRACHDHLQIDLISVNYSGYSLAYSHHIYSPTGQAISTLNLLLSCFFLLLTRCKSWLILLSLRLIDQIIRVVLFLSVTRTAEYLVSFFLSFHLTIHESCMWTCSSRSLAGQFSGIHRVSFKDLWYTKLSETNRSPRLFLCNLAITPYTSNGIHCKCRSVDEYFYKQRFNSKRWIEACCKVQYSQNDTKRSQREPIRLEQVWHFLLTASCLRW